MPLDLKILRKWVASQSSTAEAARMLGMQRPNLIRLMSGDNDDVRLSTLEHIADVIGVDAAELIRRAKIV